MPPDFRYNSIRDPLYGFVDLSKTELRLVDTSVFRRLHSIKQLSHAYVVYPSAIHTRLEHSLGCLHIADRMCSELDVCDDDRENVRMAALLHDVGHGPFSHLFEQVIEKINPSIPNPHELITSMIIMENDEVCSIIDSKKTDIVKLLKPDRIRPFADTTISLLSSILNSGLDADKLDYLRRDSYHIGVAYGHFDLNRILHTIRSTPNKKSRICIDVKGKDALENYRLGRYLMHAQVYEHHTRLAADQMFLQAMDAAIKEDVIDESDLVISEDSSNKRFLDFYLSLNDNSIYNTILQSEKSKVSKEILLNITRRRLLKRACEFTMHDLEGFADIGDDLRPMNKEQLCDIASEVTHQLGMKEHDIIFHKSTITAKLFGEGEILVLKKGQVLDLQDLSPISATESVIKFYVYGPEEPKKRKMIVQKISDKMGIPPEKISSLT